LATLVTPTNLQKMEFNVTTAEGPGRVTIVTGTMPVLIGALNSVGQKDSFKALLDPTLTPGQFRKATATASLGAIAQWDGTAITWTIEDAQATLNDETGQVQLVIDVSVYAEGPGAAVQVRSLMFQVTTLAMV